jgi:type IV secretory pathway TrbD component
MRSALRLMYLGALLELGVLAVVAATTNRLHSAILAHHHSYTAEQWHAEFHQHLLPVEIGAPIAACVWVWLAWANGRGHRWARTLFLLFAAVTTASLLSGLAAGALTYAPGDAAAGIVLWIVALAAVALIFSEQSEPYYRRPPGRSARTRHEHRPWCVRLGQRHARRIGPARPVAVEQPTSE